MAQVLNINSFTDAQGTYPGKPRYMMVRVFQHQELQNGGSFTHDEGYHSTEKCAHTRARYINSCTVQLVSHSLPCVSSKLLSRSPSSVLLASSILCANVLGCGVSCRITAAMRLPDAPSGASLVSSEKATPLCALPCVATNKY